MLTRANNQISRLDAHGKHVSVSQTKGDNKAIRKPLHKQTYYGRVNLRRTRDISLKDAIADWRNIADREVREAVRQYIEVYHFDAKHTLRAFKENGNKLHGRDVSRVPVFYFTDDVEPLCAVRK